MKKLLKICSLLLALVLLTGCGAQPAETVATEPAATEPPTPITTEAALQEALATSGRVVVEGDIQLTKGVVVDSNYLDGAGFTITAPVYDENDIATSCGILVKRGTVENVTVKGGYRGIGTNKDNTVAGEIRLNNVAADGENCALYVANGSGSGTLVVNNSSFGGQTVFHKISHAQFENCTFTWNESGTKGNMTAYTSATLVGCRFENRADGTKYALAYPSSIDSCTMILEDCYVGDTLITQENLKTLLKVNPRNNIIEVRNTAG